MIEKRIFFNLRVNIPDLDTYFSIGTSCAKIYECELIIDHDDNNKISIKVFYNDSEMLGNKISSWDHDQNRNLLKQFEVVNIIQPSNLLNIDFLDYKCKGLTISSDFYENNYRYFILNLTGITKIYQSEENNTAEFFLNQQGFNLVEMYYRYHPNFPWNNDFKWEPKHIQEYITFEDIQFRPEYNFATLQKNSNSLIEIRKTPKIGVKHNGLTVAAIRKYADAICMLYSLYSQQNIDFSILRICSGNELHIEVRDIQDSYLKDIHGLFRWEFSSDPKNLFQSINSSLVMTNLEFITNLVSRFNYAIKIEGESRFMILYNLLEQLRNQYILDKKIEQEKAGNKPNLRRVVEMYRFTTSITKTDRAIEEALEKIVEIIDDGDKELFRREIKHKVFPIKVLSMANQFNSFFNFIDINPQEYALEFGEIKKLRDAIFHGRPINENEILLNHVNDHQRLPRFVGEVMFKYLGIKDLKNLSFR